jgi:eukaryotic-like serine/threonine-protein kinase
MKFTYGADARPVDGYTIRRGIHRGGFGEVYYAVSDAGKEVALKLLTHDLQTELRGVRQCLNLKHPNLVTIFDVRTDREGDHWVVMEYIHGSNLDDVLATFPDGLPAEEARLWFEGLMAGVRYLHERGLVHRDLKPANVYQENGIVKVGDVGLSKQLGGPRRGQHTEAVGTVYYMAPEVARGQYGPEVDIYSLGVMLYEMLCGKLPFDGETTAEILMKHLTALPDLQRLPAAYRPVVARCLEKDPQQRTATIAVLEREFHAAVQAAHHSNGSPSALVGDRGPSRFAEMPWPSGRVATTSAPPELAVGPNPGATDTNRPPATSLAQPETTEPAPSPTWYEWITDTRAAPWAIAFCIGVLLLLTVYALWSGNYRSAIVLGTILGFGAYRGIRTTWQQGPVGDSGQQSNRMSARSLSTTGSAAPVLTGQPRSASSPSTPLQPETQVAPDERSNWENWAASVLLATCSAVGLSICAGLVIGQFHSRWRGELNGDRWTWLMMAAVLSSVVVVHCHRAMLLHSTLAPLGRRGWFLVGAGLGLATAALHEALLLQWPLPTWQSKPAFQELLGLSLLEGRVPTLLGFSVFLGLVFAVLPWDRVLAPQRSRRLSIGSLFVAGGVGYLVTWLVAVPVVVAVMLPVVVIAATQLAAPWQGPSSISQSKHTLTASHRVRRHDRVNRI